MPNSSRRPNWFLRIFTHLRSIFGILFAVPFTFLTCFVAFGAAVIGQSAATRVMRIWSGTLLTLFGIRLRVNGQEHLPAHGGAIIVFNHQSLFDIPCLMMSTKKHIRFGAKIELFKIPFFGQAMRKVGTLPIARDNRNEVLRIYRDAEKRFRDNTLFVLAPEGTRQKEPVLGRFKKGPFIFAINARVPVVPVVIKGNHYVLPKKSVAINVDRLVRTIEIEYLPAISTEGLSTANVDDLVARARTAMASVYDRLPEEDALTAVASSIPDRR